MQLCDWNSQRMHIYIQIIGMGKELRSGKHYRHSSNRKRGQIIIYGLSMYIVHSHVCICGKPNEYTYLDTTSHVCNYFVMTAFCILVALSVSTIHRIHYSQNVLGQWILRTFSSPSPSPSPSPCLSPYTLYTHTHTHTSILVYKLQIESSYDIWLPLTIS